MGLPKNFKSELPSRYSSGKLDLISDVPSVTVGHTTLRSGDINTGVTAVLPHEGNIFREKLIAGASVINGFGKSMGIIQLQELGTLETPIIMTNTMSIGTAYTALARYMMFRNSDIGVSTGTVNCMITECNDGRLNDIRGFHVTEEHVLHAVETASAEFDEGAVGGGTGMRCFGLKGGIGSASRILKIGGSQHVIGSLVMTNFGRSGDLIVGGKRIEQMSAAGRAMPADPDRGSVIVVIATDIPLSSRQLTRVSRRSMISLGRTGSFCGNGSGDIAIAFSTANRIPHYPETDILDLKFLSDSCMDSIFDASVEAVEEAVISSLYHAETVTGIRNTTVQSLRDFLAGADKK